MFIPQKSSKTNVLKRFEREAKALARLSTTRLRQSAGYGEHEGPLPGPGIHPRPTLRETG